jgi:hypothetical protein
MSSAWEKFQGATITLARSGAIKDRLALAYRNFLAEISEEELPRELREEFRALCLALTREPPLLRGEDAVQATVRKMSSLDADDAAAALVRLFGSLPHGAAAAPRLNTPAQVVPLFLTAP